jgi:sentrin-specific protease 1
MNLIQVFVPIHKEVHWCLAVINVKDKKLQYLDSLGGMDTIVLRTLVHYLSLILYHPLYYLLAV